MAIFSFFSKLIQSLAFMIILLIISYLLVLSFYFNNKLGDQYPYFESEIYLVEEIEDIVIFHQKNIKIDIKFKENKDDIFLLTYAFYYFDLYHKEIYLFELNKWKLITIDQLGNSSLTTF
jgi:hypothetical protein